jgi:hypothetical protein
VINSLNQQIESLLKKTIQLMRQNMNQFKGSKINPDLVLVYTYCVEDEFSNYFVLFEKYITELSDLYTLLSNANNSNNINPAKNGIDGFLGRQAELLFKDSVGNAMIFLNSFLDRIQDKNLQFGKNVSYMRKSLTDIFFNLTRSINDNLDKLLDIETNKNIDNKDEKFYNITLALSRISALLFAKITDYRSKIQNVDDYLHRAYLILRKLFIQISWLSDQIASLQGENELKVLVENLNNNIVDMIKKNQSMVVQFKQSIVLKDPRFESLLNSGNKFIFNMINYKKNLYPGSSAGVPAVNSGGQQGGNVVKQLGNTVAKLANNSQQEDRSIYFKGNLDLEKVIKKFYSFINVMEENLRKIEKKKYFCIGQVNLLTAIDLLENDLLENIATYKMTKIEKGELYPKVNSLISAKVNSVVNGLYSKDNDVIKSYQVPSHPMHSKKKERKKHDYKKRPSVVPNIPNNKKNPSLPKIANNKKNTPLPKIGTNKKHSKK